MAQSSTKFSFLSYIYNMAVSRPKTSPVWPFVADIREDGSLPFNSSLQPVFRCKPCVERGRPRPAEFRRSAGTRAFMKHLKLKHKINLEDRSVASVARDAAASQAIFARGGFLLKAKNLVEHPTIDGSALRVHFLEWIIQSGLPLSTAKSPPFRAFLQYINPNANESLPRSHTTIRADLRFAVNARMPTILDSFAAARSRIHLLSDVWTSPNGYAIMGIQAQYIDSKWRQQCVTIDLQHLRGAHDGRNLASAMGETIDTYRIAKSLGYIVLDNASNNNTLLAHLAEDLRQQDVEWDPIHHHIRCFGHVVNLAASAFIYVDRAELPEVEDAEGWRRFGCLGKLHNLVIYIQSSPQRQERWREFSGGLNLRRDNATRWNSWYIAVERALRPLMKVAIRDFCDADLNLRAERLSPDDWDNLTDIFTFLGPFYDVTMATQGIFDAIDRVLPGMDFLLAHLEQERRRWAKDGWMGHRVDAAWQKLVQYYERTDATVAYFAATVLNPIYKTGYFTKNWNTGPLRAAARKLKGELEALWQERYRPATRADGKTEREAEGWGAITGEYRPNSFTNWTQEHLDGELDDELAIYLQEAPLKGVNANSFRAIDWWLEISQRDRYPNLSKLAIDVLSVPAMTAEAERLFSACRKTCERCRTLPASLKDVQLFRSWTKSTIFEGIQLVS